MQIIIRRAALGGLLVGGLALAGPPPAAAEDLATYTATCKDKVGVDVEAFNCTTGFEIPMVGTAGADCEKPPYLSSASCRKGSRLGVQVNAGGVAIVWLCRKKQITDPNSVYFDDVAVIQTNFVSGATCFYQKLAPQIDGRNVPAPRTNTGPFWFQPAEAYAQECASCHDTGLIRTPYLTQVKDNLNRQVLPTQRHRDAYWFPGVILGAWNGKVKRIDDRLPFASRNCTKCHPMGANDIDPSSGTSTELGPMAAGAELTPHLIGHTAFWMSPTAARDGRPLPDDIADAERMKVCAGNTDPECPPVVWKGQIEAVRALLRGRILPDRKQPPEGPPRRQE